MEVCMLVVYYVKPSKIAADGPFIIIIFFIIIIINFYHLKKIRRCFM